MSLRFIINHGAKIFPIGEVLYFLHFSLIRMEHLKAM